MRHNNQFIMNSGGCVVSNNILQHKGNLKWCVRETPVNNLDNGWRFISDIDTDEYLSDPKNMSVCDFNSVAEIEPAIIQIYSYEVGSDLTLVCLNGTKVFVDSTTGLPIVTN